MHCLSAAQSDEYERDRDNITEIINPSSETLANPSKLTLNQIVQSPPPHLQILRVVQ